MRKFTDNPNYNFPITPGHEIAGVVETLGSNTSWFHLFQTLYHFSIKLLVIYFDK